MMKNFIESFLSFDWIDIFLIDLLIASIGLSVLVGFIWIIGKLEEYYG